MEEFVEIRFNRLDLKRIVAKPPQHLAPCPCRPIEQTVRRDDGPIVLVQSDKRCQHPAGRCIPKLDRSVLAS